MTAVDPLAVGQHTLLEVRQLSVFYRNQPLLSNVSLTIQPRQLVTLIGASGSGKSLLLSCLNRLIELFPHLHVTGEIHYRQHALKEWNALQLRCRMPMIFSRPSLFPTSIYENVAFGARVHGYQGDLDALVQSSLEQVNLWQTLKNHLGEPALELSLEQQQRLCLARAIALQPEILLLDDPCRGLDTTATRRMEECLCHLKQTYTLIMATHHLRQAARISDWTAFLALQTNPQGQTVGQLIEYAPTRLLFQRPQHPLTCDYVSGRF
ncbi:MULTISPECIES: phosphate ABC transporter ATP-binding protein [unclassified Thermosynechococcus]|uniref:phosphate ABC transporter ATP-binding protein n=1 Tax=unclassified Thermosynechococcus TaxID=2622553 RepID=UPI00197D7BF7|nr:MULTISPECIES: ATP-binding cassette domain-containing protein [unclassified Thermosynechococcus]MDR5640271.1 ATP-binding cassette domain-containing protein [Thermosynechococcus sp. PP42]MDR7923061.1 ATP-binding cassette domain-containing protein [Thermosynechococcus sp. HY213]QSF49169.1 ATP-binding cassette domain-containing protein [Thermosynechococcus sp. TA-1]WKT81179.1 ATP-binding cassette domain-containing protein [Thermosynechococcus sp. PP45]WNC24790.1 ATP-binding cassette domain-cont